MPWRMSRPRPFPWTCCAHVVVPTVVRNLRALAPCERFQRVRQVPFRRHRGPVHEHGQNGNSAFESLLDFGAHPIIGVVESSVPCGIGACQPARADDRDQSIGSLQGAGDRGAEVITAGDAALDIHEHRLVAEPARQTIEEPASRPAAVDTPIAHKHSGHTRRSVQRLYACIGRWRRIIQLIPKRSRTSPKRLAKNVSSIFISTSPPSASAAKIRSASASLSTFSDR